jgi:very-short-patch-repair endonuclease
MRHLVGIHDLAVRQHGVVSRAQVLDAGWHPSRLVREVRAGRLLRVHRGVYAVGHRPTDELGRWMAAVLAAGDGAALSYRSAGALHRAPVGDRGLTHVTSPTAIRDRRIVSHRATLDPRDVTVVRGIPVTTVARTLADLDHEIADDEDYEEVVREAMFRGLFDAARVRDVLTRRPAKRLGRYVDDRLPSQSRLEIRMLRLCRSHGIPDPQTQRGQHPRVDFLWPEHRLVVEVDGWRAHGHRVAFQRDRANGNVLVLAGLRVLRFTWDDVTRRPDRVAAQIRAGLGLA